MNGKFFLCFIISNYIYIFRDTVFLLIWIWLKCVCVLTKFALLVLFLLFIQVQKTTIVSRRGKARDTESYGSDGDSSNDDNDNEWQTKTNEWLCWLLSFILNTLYPVYNGDSKTMKLPPSNRYIMSSYDHYNIK